jgi:hypothetical protein
MGLVTKLLLAPLAPVAGVVWLAEQLERQAHEIYYSPQAIAEELRELQRHHEAGVIGDADLEAAEAALLERLVEASETQ